MSTHWLGGSLPSHTSWGDIAIDLLLVAEEDDAVIRGISFVPLHLLIRNGDTSSVGDNSLRIRNYSYVVVHPGANAMRIR
jgi:hypothetical protein